MFSIAQSRHRTKCHRVSRFVQDLICDLKHALRHVIRAETRDSEGTDDDQAVETPAREVQHRGGKDRQAKLADFAHMSRREAKRGPPLDRPPQNHRRDQLADERLDHQAVDAEPCDRRHDSCDAADRCCNEAAKRQRSKLHPSRQQRTWHDRRGANHEHQREPPQDRRDRWLVDVAGDRIGHQHDQARERQRDAGVHPERGVDVLVDQILFAA